MGATTGSDGTAEAGPHVRGLSEDELRNLGDTDRPAAASGEEAPRKPSEGAGRPRGASEETGNGSPAELAGRDGAGAEREEGGNAEERREVDEP